MKKKNKAFTLLEIMMGLVVVSLMLAVMAPVITAAGKAPDRTNIQVSNAVVDATPVGVIVAWYGTNYPNGWIPLNGQPVDTMRYPLLRDAIGSDILPNLNSGVDPVNSTTWIIKAEKAMQ